MRNRRLQLAAVALLAAVTLFYFKVYLPKSTFTFVTPQRGSLEVSVFGVAEIDAKMICPIGSQTGGMLVGVFKDQGQQVKQGELVATVDPVDLPDLLAQSKIAMAKAELETAAAQKERDSLMAQLGLARITHERYERLFQQGYAARAELDKAASEFKSLSERVEAADIRIASGREEQKRSRKSVDALEQKLSRYSLYAPVDGLVVSKDAEAGQTLLPAQPVLTIVNVETVWVRTYIDERISGGIRVGQKAKIMLRSQQDRMFEGRVVRIEATSDPVTQERVVDVAFVKVPDPFYLNEQAEVYIVLRTLEDVLKIPLGVLVPRGQQIGVWVAEEKRARFKALTILARDDKEAAVEGIGADADILVPSPDKKPLFEGTRIRI